MSVSPATEQQAFTKPIQDGSSILYITLVKTVHYGVVTNMALFSSMSKRVIKSWKNTLLVPDFLPDRRTIAIVNDNDFGIAAQLDAPLILAQT
ncbi:MAG: hypothetical protein U0M19_08250 [Caecibacter sp.]|nr:hypothetical protein [Caecibacter sp.]